MIGIVCKYHGCEAAYAACRLASAILMEGGETSIYSLTPPKRGIDPIWDDQVQWSKTSKFTPWASGKQALLWTEVPSREQHGWAQSNKLKTYLMAGWNTITPRHARLLRKFDCLISPHVAGARWLQEEFALAGKVVYFPWDVGCPITTKRDFTDRDAEGFVRILVPLWDNGPNDLNDHALACFDWLLRADPMCKLSFAYTNSRMPTAGARRLYRLLGAHALRVKLIKGVAYSDRPSVYAAHDLTLWLSHLDDFSLAGLTSVSMGTPVASFCYPPVQEVLSPACCLPVECSVLARTKRAPLVTVNYAGLFNRVQQMLASRVVLPAITPEYRMVLEGRRKEFRKAVQRLVEGNLP